MRAAVQSVVGLAIAVLAGGCQRPGAATYEPRMDMAVLAPGLRAPDNGFAVLADQPSRGRFACGLALAKLSPTGADGALTLVAIKPNEQAYWAEKLTGVPAIRELLFLSPIDTRGAGEGRQALCALAERLGAGLLLVYVPNRYGPNAVQVLGVLYDVQQREPIATLHASADFTGQRGRAGPPDDERGDHRDSDAAYRAPRAFESQALACVLELVRRDSYSPATQPHQWQVPEFDERWWIPRRIKVR